MCTEAYNHHTKAMHLFITVFNIYFYFFAIFVSSLFSIHFYFRSAHFSFVSTVFFCCCQSGFAAVLYLNYLFEVLQVLVHLVSRACVMPYCCKYVAVWHLINILILYDISILVVFSASIPDRSWGFYIIIKSSFLILEMDLKPEKKNPKQNKTENQEYKTPDETQ